MIRSGTRWREAIEQALAEAKVAVLLVSADFLASDFIADDELPPLLAAAAADGTVILPVILSPSRFKQTPLAQFQAVNPPSQPLIGLAKAKQEAVFVQVAEAIERALGFPVSAAEKPTAVPVSRSTPGSSSQSAVGGNSLTGPSNTTGGTHLWEKIAAFSFGMIFVTALLAIAIVEPTLFQYQVFRIILALACAGVAAVIPGLLDIRTDSLMGLVIRAGGALAVFVLVYLVNPAQMVAPTPADTPEPVIEENEEAMFPKPDLVPIPSRDFSISRHEITFEQYDHYAEKTGKSLPDDRGWGRMNRPVISVNLNEAKAYADWLSDQLGQECRLPSEEEWEYAARAGGSGEYGLGEGGVEITRDNLDDYAWYEANSGEQTRPVGSKKPNAWGLYDIFGNVWEWCGNNGRICGGGWRYGPSALRVAFHRGSPPNRRAAGLGFRVVCVPHLKH